MKIRDDKVFYEWSDYAKDMRAVDWINCDHVIAIYRGSLGMATHVSNLKDIPMSIVGFQTRDGKNKEPYWIHNATQKESYGPYATGTTYLIVDDIYDTGHTMDKVIDFVTKSRTKPSPLPKVIGYCLFGKENAKDIVYSQEHDGSWIVFPWEHHESV